MKTTLIILFILFRSISFSQTTPVVNSPNTNGVNPTIIGSTSGVNPNGNPGTIISQTISNHQVAPTLPPITAGTNTVLTTSEGYPETLNNNATPVITVPSNTPVPVSTVPSNINNPVVTPGGGLVNKNSTSAEIPGPSLAAAGTNTAAIDNNIKNTQGSEEKSKSNKTPVFATYIPADIVKQAKSKYGNSVYDITRIKTSSGIYKYRVRIRENGKFRNEIMESGE